MKSVILSSVARGAAVALAGMHIAAAGQTMYRCQQADGSQSFQQAPCPAGAAGQAIAAREVPVTTMGDNIRAIARRNASGEMSEADLVRRLGAPSVVNTDVIDGVVQRQYVYRWAGRTQYYYTRGGVVYAVQDRPEPPRRTPQPCYSRADLRSAEIDASSIRLDPMQRREAEERLAAMRDCRR